VGGAEIADELLEVMLVAGTLVRCVCRTDEMTILTDQDIDSTLPARALLSCHLPSLHLSSFLRHLAEALKLAQARMHSHSRPTAHSFHCLCSRLLRIDKVVALICLSGHRSGG